MFQQLVSSSKTRREYITKLYEALNAAVYGYACTLATPIPNSSDYMVRVVKETMDLKRFLRMPFASQYLWQNRQAADGGNLIKLMEVPADGAGSSVLF